MYRDESKNLLNNINWSEYINSFVSSRGVTMYDENTCSILGNNITAKPKSSYFSGSFLYLITVGFANSYQNNIENDNSYSIRCANVTINNVIYSATPIFASFKSSDLYEYSISIRMNYPLNGINITGGKTIPTSVFSNFSSVWLLAPNMNDILK